MLVLALAAPGGGGEGKKKRFIPKGDKKDDVAGAIWSWEAEDLKSGETKKGRVRVADFVLYDIETAKSIGKITPRDKSKSELHFQEPFPLPGTATVENIRLDRGKGVTVWKGVLKSQDAQWALRMQMVDQ